MDFEELGSLVKEVEVEGEEYTFERQRYQVGEEDVEIYRIRDEEEIIASKTVSGSEEDMTYNFERMEEDMSGAEEQSGNLTEERLERVSPVGGGL